MSELYAERVIPEWLSIFCGVVFSLTVVFGCVENLLVLFMFITTKRLRTPTNYFIVALAFADLAMAVFAVPLAAYSGFVGYWEFDEVLCIMQGWFVYCFSLTSMYLLAALAVDRCIRITKTSRAHMITARVVCIVVGICFFGGAFWSMLPLIGLGSYAVESNRIACGLDWQDPNTANKTYVGCIFVFCYLVPVGTMVYSYFKAVCINSYHSLPNFIEPASV